MIFIRNKHLERFLHRGETFGLVFVAVMLIVVEASCIYWLNHIQLPDRPLTQSGFLVLPPWHRRPRFEVTLLLTIAAGMLFSFFRGVWNLWLSRKENDPAEAWARLRRRLSAAASVTALAGFNLALATWLAR